MTGRRVVVIPNAVRDLYTAISTYIALREPPCKPQFVRMYAAGVTHSSLTLRQAFGNCSARDDTAAPATASPCLPLKGKA